MATNKNTSPDVDDEGPVASFLESLYLPGAFLASVALSICAYYTTFEGAQYAMPRFVAIFFTFGLQFLVFMLAWLVANAIYRRRLKSATSYVVAYVLAAAFSIIFSYCSIYEIISGEAQRRDENARHGRDLVNPGMREIAEVLLKNETEQHKAFVASEAYERWRKAANEVITFSQRSSASIEAAIRSKRERDTEALKKFESEATEANAAIRRAQADLDRAGADVRRLDPIVKDLNDKFAPTKNDIEQMEIRLKTLKEQMRQEETKGSGDTKITAAGRGPVWKGLKTTHDNLELGYNGKKRDAGAQLTLLSNREKELTAAREAMEKAGRTISEANQTLTTMTPQLKEAQDRVKTNAASPTGRVDDMAARFRNSITDFEKDRTVAKLDTSQQLCVTLLAEINSNREAIKEKPPQGLQCVDAQLSTMMKALQTTGQRTTDFDAQCSAKSSASPSTKRTFSEIADTARNCIRIAALSNDEKIGSGFLNVGGLQDRLSKEESYRRTFTKADKEEDPYAEFRARLALYTRTLVVDGSPQAYAAAGLAVGIDMLLLLIAIAGRNMQAQRRIERSTRLNPLEQMRSMDRNEDDADTPQVASMKRLLNALQVPGDGEDMPIDLEAAGLGSDANAGAFIAALAASGQARRARSGSKPIYYITQSGYHSLHAKLAQLANERAVVKPFFVDDAIRDGGARRPAAVQAQAPAFVQMPGETSQRDKGRAPPPPPQQTQAWRRQRNIYDDDN